MSTFQISLAVLGLLLLGLVLAYNAWQTRRNAPKKRNPQPPGMGGSTAPRHDPVLHSAEDVAPPAAQPPQPPQAVQDNLPPLAVPAATRQAGAAAQAGSEQRPALSPLLDAIATIVLPQPMAGHVILQTLPLTKRAGSKPFQVEGKAMQSQQWEEVHADQQYGYLQAGVQLANRLGPLNDIEFSEFAHKVQDLADSLGARVELPDMLEEVARARELDAFAAQQDIQLSFTLRPRRTAWSTGYIDQQVATHGFVPVAAPGRMYLPGSVQGESILSLAFDPEAAQAEDLDRTAIYEISMSLDVPQVAPELAPFGLMCQILHALAQDMDAVLCDASGNVVAPELLAQIGQDLENYYTTLSSRNLAAGSMLARRLFS